METLLEKIKKSMHKKKAKDYDSWASEMMKDNKKVEEALTAKQKKHIDVNDNEKIDAEDFEMLRKKKKQVKEEFDNSFKDELNEVLSKDATAADYIKDFVNSDNPKFKGKSKKERIKMALGAYYSKQRNEEHVQEASKAELAAMAAAAMKSGVQVKKVQPGERTVKDNKLYKAMKKGEKVKGDDESYIDQKRLEGISASFKGKPTGKRKVKEEVDQEKDTKKN